CAHFDRLGIAACKIVRTGYADRQQAGRVTRIHPDMGTQVQRPAEGSVGVDVKARAARKYWAAASISPLASARRSSAWCAQRSSPSSPTARRASEAAAAIALLAS